MDRKTIIILVLTGALLFLWPLLTNKLFPPVPKGTNQITLSTNVATNTITITAPTNVPAATNLAVTTLPQQPVIAPATPAEILELETKEAVYQFTSHGGG